jgi:transcriptional regulator with XRE-family HTH domain
VKLDRDRILRARELLGYGVEKTAEVAGVSKNSVLRAEHAEDIRPITARKIAAALEVEVRDLLPLGQAPLPLESSYGALLEDRGFSSEQIAAALAQDARDEAFLKHGLEQMSPKDMREALMAWPGFRRTWNHYRENDTEPNAPRSESA